VPAPMATSAKARAAGVGDGGSATATSHGSMSAMRGKRTPGVTEHPSWIELPVVG
jgi:hypothetical protein